MLKRDFSDIVYRALANYFDIQVLKSKLGRRVFPIDASITETVSSGDVIIALVAPPDGKVWYIKDAIWLVAPPDGASTGTHKIRICQSYSADWFSVTQEKSYSESLSFINQVTTAETKENYVAIMDRLRNLPITKSYPLQVRYYNNTDVDQTNEIGVWFFIEEFDEVV